MNHGYFSILARRGSASRLGIIEAAQAKPMTANARKNKKRKKGDVNKRCKQQAEEWNAFFPTFCPEGPICDALVTCSSLLTLCDFTGFLGCLESEPQDLADGSFTR